MGIEAIVSFLFPVNCALALAPGHFAAHHYLTHAYENTGRVARALAEGAT